LYRSEKLTARLETPRETPRSNEDMVAPGTRQRGDLLAKGRDWAQMGRAGGGYQPLETLSQRETRYISIHYLVEFAVFFGPLSQMRCDVKFNRAKVCATQARRSAPLSVCPTAKTKSTWTDIGIGSLGCHHGAAAKAQSTSARMMADILG
jgi:hypothetical protein